MYFVDELGNVQLTGSGLLITIIVAIVVVISVWEMVKKILFYKSEYYRLKNELDSLEKEFDKKFPKALETYYQRRKNWEKRNGFW